MKKTIIILVLLILIMLLAACNNQNDFPVENCQNECISQETNNETLNISQNESISTLKNTECKKQISKTESTSSIVNKKENNKTTNISNILHDTSKDRIKNNTLSTTFNDEQLLEIYALDVKNHVTVRYNLSDTVKKFEETDFVKLLENCDTQPKNTKKAFILFTDKGRHYIYLDDNVPKNLIDIWNIIYHNEKANKSMHWLTHMTTNKITEITYDGTSISCDTMISLKVDKKETIKEMSEYLKNSLFVNADKPIEISNGATNFCTPMGLYTMEIKFDSGVNYFFIGYGDYGHTDKDGSGISIYTSDLNKSIHYNLNEGEAGFLREFMKEKQIEFWNENGYPTKMNVSILPNIKANEKLHYSENLVVPLLIGNQSDKKITITADYFATNYIETERYIEKTESWEHVQSNEIYDTNIFLEIMPKESKEILIPFNIYNIEDNGKGKYRTYFWVNEKFKIVGNYIIE